MLSGNFFNFHFRQISTKHSQSFLIQIPCGISLREEGLVPIATMKRWEKATFLVMTGNTDVVETLAPVIRRSAPAMIELCEIWI